MECWVVCLFGSIWALFFFFWRCKDEDKSKEKRGRYKTKRRHLKEKCKALRGKFAALKETYEKRGEREAKSGFYATVISENQKRISQIHGRMDQLDRTLASNSYGHDAGPTDQLSSGDPPGWSELAALHKELHEKQQEITKHKREWKEQIPELYREVLFVNR